MVYYSVVTLSGVFGDVVDMQDATERKSQFLIISYCFIKSDANFMSIESANMDINLAQTLGVELGFMEMNKHD